MAVTNPFQVEKKRHELAKKKDYPSLIKLYSSKHQEVKDQNSPLLWDKLNSVQANLKKENPMAYDKYKKVSGVLKKGRVLHVGTGPGYLEEMVLDDNPNIDWYEIDISGKSIKRMKKKHPKYHFQTKDITKTDFTKDYFDHIVVLDVLEHVLPRNIFKTLKELKRSLKKNGQLIVSVPLNEKLEEMIERGENPNAHVRVYTPEIIKAELEISGLQIDSEEYLFAFGSFYTIKSVICRYLKNFREPNLIILYASL